MPSIDLEAKELFSTNSSTHNRIAKSCECHSHLPMPRNQLRPDMLLLLPQRAAIREACTGNKIVARKNTEQF